MPRDHLGHMCVTSWRMQQASVQATRKWSASFWHPFPDDDADNARAVRHHHNLVRPVRIEGLQKAGPAFIHQQLPERCMLVTVDSHNNHIPIGWYARRINRDKFPWRV